MWGYLFGRGIIDPIDDIRAGNPPSNPELLDALTHEFVAHQFDMQHLIRTICKSRVYQQSIRTNKWNQDDDLNYSHAVPRRLPAETLFDAIHVATGSLPRIAGAPAGFRATLMTNDPKSRCAKWESGSNGAYRYVIATQTKGKWSPTEDAAIRDLRKRVASEIRKLEKDVDRDPNKGVRLAFLSPLRGWE